jgi:hypothetical protein
MRLGLCEEYCNKGVASLVQQAKVPSPDSPTCGLCIEDTAKGHLQRTIDSGRSCDSSGVMACGECCHPPRN